MAPIKQGLYEFKKDTLIEIRKELGVSQGKMAELLGVPANTLSRWETGATIPDAGSLASIYSLARDHGIDTPSFFGMREDLPPIKIGSSDTSQDSVESLSFYPTLKSCLKTQIEDIGSAAEPVIKVEITNTAPEGPDLPKIVFMGVGLSISNIGGSSQNFANRLKPRTTRPTKAEEIEANVTPWENDSKRKGLLNSPYQRLDNKTFPDFTPNEREQGEILFPGDSIIYEIDVPRDLLPYLQFRVEGNVSRRYLFHCEETFEMPEDLTKPLAINALSDFNSIEIHKLLVSITESIPDFNNDARLSEIHRFNTLLSENIAEVKTMQDNINNVFRQHTLNWFRAHLRAAYIYLDVVKETLGRLKEAIESNDPDKIAAEISGIQALKSTASQFNRETEDLMETFNISDEEVGYRYRSMN
jgi:transcriptional regulator with XRE-family HTH domain